MNSRPLRVALVAFALCLPGGVGAQSLDGPRMPAETMFLPDPTIEVEVTGSTEPRVIPAFPESTDAVRVTGSRPACDVQTYIVGSGQRVRVHRC